MTNQPLLVLSEQRLQHEVQSALAAAAATHYQLVRERWLIAACLIEFVGGLTLMGSPSMSRARTSGKRCFLAALSSGILAQCGPGFWPIGMGASDRDVAA